MPLPTRKCDVVGNTAEAKCDVVDKTRSVIL